jgi:hypothetical protein
MKPVTEAGPRRAQCTVSAGGGRPMWRGGCGGRRAEDRGGRGPPAWPSGSPRLGRDRSPVRAGSRLAGDPRSGHCSDTAPMWRYGSPRTGWSRRHRTAVRDTQPHLGETRARRPGQARRAFGWTGSQALGRGWRTHLPRGLRLRRFSVTALLRRGGLISWAAPRRSGATSTVGVASPGRGRRGPGGRGRCATPPGRLLHAVRGGPGAYVRADPGRAGGAPPAAELRRVAGTPGGRSQGRLRLVPGEEAAVVLAPVHPA